MNNKDKKYTTLMVKKELKEQMDKDIKSIGIEMSYSAYIKHLMSKNKSNRDE